MPSEPKPEADLYSYTVRYDDGAAPNPFNGMCTLAICKPAIRRTAAPGDWIAGLGSARYGKALHLVYAMQIAEVLTWKEYDARASREWPHRVPDLDSTDLTRQLGDCIYDHSTSERTQRRSVHTGGGQRQRDKDLNGDVLVARRYLYFGSSEMALPSVKRRDLTTLVLRGQGHKRQSNMGLLPKFVDWYSELEARLGNGQHGWPRLVLRRTPDRKNAVVCVPICSDGGDEDREVIC